MNRIKHNENDPWWITALKVIAYLIQLILAGGAGASLSQLGNWNWF